ncbi:hypothetical protein Aduo_006812 [Ancylostoma duodenale]
MKKAIKYVLSAAAVVAIIAAIIAVVLVFVLKKDDAHGESDKTTLEPIEPKTSTKPGTSVATKTTQKPSQKPSQEPSKEPTKPSKPTLPPGSTSSQPPSKAGFRCLFVGDLYNYGHNGDAYELEADLIADVAHDLYSEYGGSSIGLWAYGYTNFPRNADSGLKNMKKNYNDFLKDLNGMIYHDTNAPLSTAEAIEQLNQLKSSKDVVNCLVFFSAERKVGQLPVIYPRQLPVDIVVAVGLNDTDLSSRVQKENGISVSVPIHYMDKDVKAIVDAITKKIKPTPKPTTTVKTTTTAPPSAPVHCLFAGDLYNYGHNADDYDMEADLMDAVAYDLFGRSSQSSLGLWAYGYTNFSKDPSTSLGRIRKNHEDFKGDLVSFDYVKISDPLTTKTAIEALNAMRDNNKRINCLVFYSAIKNTNGLPTIDPENLGLEKVVAVGLDNANLNALLPSNGIAVSVPKHFLDSHVTQIVNAIMGRPTPVTTRTTLTTKAPETTMTTKKPTSTVPSMDGPKCLVVGDVYNFGHEAEKYGDEAELIALIGFDFLLDSDGGLGLAFWAYGYTQFSKNVNDSLKEIRRNYDEFARDVVKMKYTDIANPLSSESAIKAINEMYDSQRRVNCLVFFSAQ